MTSRERVIKAINHQLPDRVPRDPGTTLVTGVHASAYAKLKQALGITDGHERVYDPFQILAEVESPVRRALKIDTIGVQLPKTVFGYKNEKWKPFRLFDGTEVSVSKHFEFDTLDNGDIVQYPRGDRSVPPSAKMPKDGYYFENTDYALIGNFGGAAFSNIAYVPGPHLAYPRGIRDPEQWLMSMITRKQYIRDVHRRQFEIQMQNLKLYHQAVGERIQVIYMSGTDFGAQEGPFISPLLFRELFKPFLKQMNDWVHANTTWKTFYHTCGSVVDFLEDFVEAGFDILNPVQISAKGMNPQFLKNEYGDRLVFWGGGYVFTPVHNIQANVPVENILALFD
jgi:hypothetical protein